MPSPTLYMRAPTFLILLAAANVGFLSGCSTSSDPEERAFFNRGWVNPRELDNTDHFGRINRWGTSEQPPSKPLDGPLR